MPLTPDLPPRGGAIILNKGLTQRVGGSGVSRSNTLGLMVRRCAIAGAACVHLAAMRAVSNHGSKFRTRGHPSRRPRHSASKTRVNALRARAPQDEVRVMEASGARPHDALDLVDRVVLPAHRQ